MHRQWERFIPRLYLGLGSFCIIFVISLTSAILYRDYFQATPQLYNDFVAGTLAWSATNRSVDLQAVIVFLFTFLTLTVLVNSLFKMLKKHF